MFVPSLSWQNDHFYKRTSHQVALSVRVRVRGCLVLGSAGEKEGRTSSREGQKGGRKGLLRAKGPLRAIST